MHKEIERKWLCKGYPGYLPNCEFLIFTHYLYVADGFELRVQRKIDSQSRDSSPERKLTFKFGSGISRYEHEVFITKEEYDSLVELVPYVPISKEARIYQADGDTVWVSKIDDEWFYAEVEFDSLDAANSFHPAPRFPTWKEVTGNPEYAMKNYWVKTRLGGNSNGQ